MQTETKSYKMLRRSNDDRVLAGVCGGLGRYLNVDPIVLRVALVVLILGAGTGLLLYAIAWLVIPRERPGDEVGPAPRSMSINLPVGIGLALIAIGLLMFGGGIFDHLEASIGPIIVIAIGVAVLLRSDRARP